MLEEQQGVTQIPSIYTLFEQKPYLQLLQEKAQTQRLKRYYEALESELKLEEERIKNAIMEHLLNLFIIANEELKLGIEEDLNVLTTIDNYEDFKNYVNEKIKPKIDYKLLYERYRHQLNHLTQLYIELYKIKQSLERLEYEKRKGENLANIYNTLIEFLELYPKHLRMGNLDAFEVKAMRYISDTYFVLLSKALVFNDPLALQKANFVVLPFIVNIQETSLSKEAFFLRLVHSAPLIPSSSVSMPVEEPPIEQSNSLAKVEVMKEALKSDKPVKKESLLKKLIMPKK